MADNPVNQDSQEGTTPASDLKNKKDSPGTSQRILSGLGTAGRYAGKGAVVAGAAGLAAGAAMARSTGSAIKDNIQFRRAESSGTGGLFVLFILAIALHFLDMTSEFIRIPLNMAITFSYILFVLLGLFLFKVGDHIDTKEFIIAAMVAYFLPFLKSLSETFMKDYVWLSTLTGLIALIPPLVIYIAFKFPDNSKINKLARLYTIVWIFILLMYLFANFGVTQSIGKKSVVSPGESVKVVMQSISNTWGKFSTGFTKSLNAGIAKATGEPNPGTMEKQSGVFIESFKPLESRYSEESEIFMQAKVSAKELSDPMSVEFTCRESAIRTGKTRPSKSLITGNEKIIVDCDMGKLTEGTHEVIFEATFEPKTTSDITYTFVKYFGEGPIKTASESNGVAQSISTGGPVLLSMTPADGPIIVYDRPIKEFENINPDELNTRVFGVSLVNQWPKGKVHQGKEYTINIPEAFDLENCNRKPQKVSADGKYIPETVNGRKSYTFDFNTELAKSSFDSISCDLKIASFEKLFQNGDEAQVTLTSTAKYIYVVTEKQTIKVDK